VVFTTNADEFMWKRPQYYVKKTTGFRFFFLLEEEV